MKLYWAYGSNLNVEQMRMRCPGARKLGRLDVPNCALVFRGVADVAYAPGEKCPGGLWEITEENERALDAYEGVSSGLYVKRYLRIRFNASGQEARVLYYQMKDDGIMPPAEYYLSVIEQGYRDFRLPRRYLRRAVSEAWDYKDKSPLMQRRYRQKGFPKLAEVK